MQYKLGNETLKSRRGDYQLALLDTNPIIWTPKPIDLEKPRHRDVSDEITYALIGKLGEHKYWANEPLDWIKAYQDFYSELFKLKWLHKNDDRHNIVVSPSCCLTLVQYHNHRLIAYSRSTDMRNGYFSDRLLLNFLAYHIKVVKRYPTSEEVCEYLSGFYGRKVLYDNTKNEHVFYFEESKIIIVKTYYDGYINFADGDYHHTNNLYPSLITLIGRFYEGMEKGEGE